MTKITIDRAIVEQALEALKSCSGVPHWPALQPTIDALRAALAEPKTCTWQQDGDSDSGVYTTSCGNYFHLEDGTPEDNKMSHCCYCGKKLTQELITENDDD